MIKVVKSEFNVVCNDRLLECKRSMFVCFGVYNLNRNIE